MQIKPGDKVAVKQEETTGEVLAIEKGIALIHTAEGFDLSYSVDDLVVHDSQLEEIAKVVDKESQVHHRKLKPKVDHTVVDLHLNRGKTKKEEALQSQLRTFQEHLSKAQKNGFPEITFIHGVGAGILRTEIEKILQKKHLKYSDASYAKYGTLSAITIYFY